MNTDKIQEAVDECTRIFNPSFRVPFPTKNIIGKDENLLISFSEYNDDISGFITYDESEQKFKMFINTNKSQKRINFTIAHELGHYFLHKEIIRNNLDFVEKEETLDSGNILYRKDIAEPMTPEMQRYEREANQFAARLLMPEKYVRKAWQVLEDVSMCALIFDVSQIAMTIRLNELGILNDEH